MISGIEEQKYKIPCIKSWCCNRKKDRWRNLLEFVGVCGITMKQLTVKRCWLFLVIEQILYTLLIKIKSTFSLLIGLFHKQIGIYSSISRKYNWYTIFFLQYNFHQIMKTKNYKRWECRCILLLILLDLDIGLKLRSVPHLY